MCTYVPFGSEFNCMHKCIYTDIISSLQEEVDVVVEQSLIGWVVVTEPLEKRVSKFHDLLHPMVLWLRERMEFFGLLEVR